MNTFGDYLKKLRIEKRLSMAELALLSGVSSSYISNVENKKRSIPSPSVLKKLSLGLGTSFTEMLIEAKLIELPVDLNNEFLVFIQNRKITFNGQKIDNDQREKLITISKLILE